MNIDVRPYADADVEAMIEIWNQIVEDGVAFPQMEPLNAESGRRFFSEQSCCGVAEVRETHRLAGLYILHPNNVGRCGHICNASYAVSADFRGLHAGEKLVLHCLEQAGNLGFRLLQFNAVVRTNEPARKLYEKLGFVEVGAIPGGFLMKDGHYEDIVIYYHTLETR